MCAMTKFELVYKLNKDDAPIGERKAKRKRRTEDVCMRMCFDDDSNLLITRHPQKFDALVKEELFLE